MAKRNSQLTELLIVAQDDYLTIVDTSAGQSKRVSVKNLTGAPDFGWTTTGEAWSFSSYSSTTLIGVVTVPTDAQLKYSIGMRVRFSQSTGGTKYATIIALTATTLSMIFSGGAILANEAISTPVYSPFKAPFSGAVNLSDDGDSFSTTYQATTSKWYDGKIIYKITHVQAVTANGNVEGIYATTIPASASRIIKVEGGVQSSGQDFHPAEYVNPNAPTLQNNQLKVSYTTGVWQVRAQAGTTGTLIANIYFVI